MSQSTAIKLMSNESFREKLSQAKEFVEGATSFSGENHFPARVNARLAVVHEVAMANAGRAQRGSLVDSARLVRSAQQASTAKKRVVWMQRAADAFSKAYKDAAACRSGCSHCCHIPVLISASEAAVIGQAIGVKPVSAELVSRESVEPGKNSPCTFLEGDRCAIYENRPVACRAHLNMDSDDLLCQLQPGASIPVPYADNRMVVLAHAEMSFGQVVTDIRHWFPLGVRGG